MIPPYYCLDCGRMNAAVFDEKEQVDVCACGGMNLKDAPDDSFEPEVY